MANTPVKDTNFNMRMNREKKQELETMFARLGMTLPEAVNIFFENSLLAGGLPFEVRLSRYNRETEMAIQETREILSGKKASHAYRSAEELFRELDNE